MAYEALEDAGYIPDSTPTFSRETFGCYIGAATHDYSHNLRQEIDLYYATGISIDACDSVHGLILSFRNSGSFPERPFIILPRT